MLRHIVHIKGCHPERMYLKNCSVCFAKGIKYELKFLGEYLGKASSMFDILRRLWPPQEDNGGEKYDQDDKERSLVQDNGKYLRISAHGSHKRLSP